MTTTKIIHRANISFSYNWNNKLFCNCFTSFRIYDEREHIPGKYFDVNLYFKTKLQTPFVAELVCVDLTDLLHCPRNFAFIDTGYNIFEFNKMIHKMYKNKLQYIELQTFAILTFKRVIPLHFPCLI
jgi:hypothetical protein